MDEFVFISYDISHEVEIRSVTINMAWWRFKDHLLSEKESRNKSDNSGFIRLNVLCFIKAVIYIHHKICGYCGYGIVLRLCIASWSRLRLSGAEALLHVGYECLDVRDGPVHSSGGVNMQLVLPGSSKENDN